MADERAVTIDESYRVRVLDSEKFSKTQQLAEGARDFCDKVSQLNDIVKTVVEAVDQQAARTESEKLRAVGKRNQVAAEAETRRRDAAAASERRRERRAELDRLVAEHESLLKVKAEQEALIAKLSGSSA